MLLRPTEIQIESTRLLIKPFTAHDADATFACITPSLTRHMAWEPPASRHDFDGVWRSWIPTIDDGSDYVFAIRLRADGSFLGLAGLHRVRTESPELGIWIREDRHRNGFGREAVTLVAHWATRTIGCASFTYPVAEANRPSRRIAGSLGGVIVESRATPKYKFVVYRIPRWPVTSEV
ncbi:GNAT family N-acetyltransferase [Paraburkholderia sp. NPDC080076]|uniref:GNAT family N-acetyltransferase n=1 Tax=Paraburkholderia sp. NPDC080076 TaxID=3390605 RepID=UPI003CFDF666